MRRRFRVVGPTDVFNNLDRLRQDQAEPPTDWRRSKLKETFARIPHDRAHALAVEPQQVVLGKTEAADRCFGLQTSMRAMPIVTMQPVEQLSRSLPGVLISTSIGPFTKCGLDEALGLAVGSWSVGFGEDLAKAKALAGCSESL